MSDWFDQYYGCNGPCSEYERLVNTPQIYSSITKDYQSCLPTPAPFDCSLISHSFSLACLSSSLAFTSAPILSISSLYVYSKKLSIALIKGCSKI